MDNLVSMKSLPNTSYPVIAGGVGTQTQPMIGIAFNEAIPAAIIIWRINYYFFSRP
jgi:hypothetical protein